MIKKDFPILKNLVYLDSAATTQKPKQVIKKISDFYAKYNSNISRGLYKLSEEATKMYNDSRKTIAEFINASPKEIIFTRSATESINFLSHTIDSLNLNGKEILLSEMEHHSNLIPWQQFAKRKKMELKFIKIKNDFTLDYEDAKEKISKNTAVLSLTHVSNSLGTINNVKFLVKLAKKYNAITIIDAAQSAPSTKIDVRDLDCDFLAFSSHKMMGPSGVGILYGKLKLLKKLKPFNFGGNMIGRVSLSGASWSSIPERFEAGTPNIEGAIGFAEAVKYINKIGIGKIESHEKELLDYAVKKLKGIEEVKIYSPKNSIGILSFNVKNIHPHDVAAILSEDNICIRAGYHCSIPLMDRLKINGTCRASFYIYNTKEDIDKLASSIKKTIKIFQNEK